VVPVDFVVSGYDVTGLVTSKDEPVLGVDFLLYSDTVKHVPCDSSVQIKLPGKVVPMYLNNILKIIEKLLYVLLGLTNMDASLLKIFLVEHTSLFHITGVQILPLMLFLLRLLSWFQEVYA
jgi:hypothetical protein